MILVSEADIFFTESLRILAERLSQSETEIKPDLTGRPSGRLVVHIPGVFLMFEKGKEIFIS